jgi:hypothetical protein
VFQNDSCDIQKLKRPYQTLLQVSLAIRLASFIYLLSSPFPSVRQNCTVLISVTLHDVMRDGRNGFIIYFDTRFRQVVSFTPWPFCLWWRAVFFYWIGSCLDPNIDTSVQTRIKFPTWVGKHTRVPCSALSHKLHWLFCSRSLMRFMTF